MATSIIELYHLSSNVARYEKARALRTLAKISANKGSYYLEMTEILVQQTNNLESNSPYEYEPRQEEVFMVELIESQPFKCPALRKPKKIKENYKKPTKQRATEIGHEYVFDIIKAKEIFDQLFGA